MALVIPKGCVTASSAALLWPPVAGASGYRVYCNDRPYKTTAGCALGVRGLLHDRVYRFEVRALLGRAEMPCGRAELTTASPPVEYDAVRYGADPTGQKDSTAALQSAVEACRPGGMVYMMAGRYLLAGTLRLKSGCNLYAEPRAVLAGASFVGSGLQDVVLMGGRWEAASIRLEGCRRVCLRDLAGGPSLSLTGCRDVTLDNAGAAEAEACRDVYTL